MFVVIKLWHVYTVCKVISDGLSLSSWISQAWFYQFSKYCAATLEFWSTLTKLQVSFHKLTLKLQTLAELLASVAVKVKYAARQYIYYVMYCISPVIFLIKDKL